jgi:hypothetical protein
MVFSFPPEERAPFSQPRKDDFSVPQRARDGINLARNQVQEAVLEMGWYAVEATK